MKIARGEIEVGRFRVPYRRYGDDDDVFHVNQVLLLQLDEFGPQFEGKFLIREGDDDEVTHGGLRG